MSFQLENANKAFTKAGMSAGTTTTLTTANAQEVSILGKSYKKAATSNEATPTTDAITGAAFIGVTANQGSVYTILRDASGNLKVAQGQVVALNSAGQFNQAPWFAPSSNDLAPIGYILVKVASGGATWTFGSSNLAGPPANTTITYVDCAGGMPPRPQIS